MFRFQQKCHNTILCIERKLIQGSETAGGLIKCETCANVFSVNRGKEICVTLIKGITSDGFKCVLNDRQSKMSMVEEDHKHSVYTPVPCAFEEEFVDFESAAQYSISSCATDEWAICVLDDEALGIGSGADDSSSGGSKCAASTTGWEVWLYYDSTVCFLRLINDSTFSIGDTIKLLILYVNDFLCIRCLLMYCRTTRVYILIWSLGDWMLLDFKDKSFT